MLRLGMDNKSKKNTTILPIESNIQSIINSTSFDIDTSLFYSYPSNIQLIYNAIPIPTDGTSQKDYSFYLGAESAVTTNDPSFINGKFILDGGDYFTQQYQPVSGVLREFHKNNFNGWIALMWYKNTDINLNYLMDNRRGLSTGIGFSLFTKNGKATLKISDGIVSESITSTNTATDNAANLIVLNKNGQTIELWLNGIKTTSTFTLLSTQLSSEKLVLFGRNHTNVYPTSNGTGFYGFSGGNINLTTTQVNQIKTEYQIRHTVTF